MKSVVVDELWVYAVKGMRGVQVDSIEITEMGIVGDREFAVLEDGHLVDQQADQWMATIAADYDHISRQLTMRHVEHGEFVHERRDEGATLEGRWVLDEFEATDQGDEVAAWLSKILGRAVRLVDAKAPWTVNMPVPDLTAVHGDPKIRFNSVSSVSLANPASLADLNQYLDQVVPIDRFRMNVVVVGLDPYEEERLGRLANGDVALSQVSVAERCIIITTDQETGQRPRNNLLRTLRAQRMKPEELRYASGMMFGNYLTIDKAGFLSVGDSLAASFVDRGSAPGSG